MSKLIVQILGRMNGQKGYEPHKYVIGHDEYETVLSSEALELWMKEHGEEVKKILLVPESLVYGVAKDVEEAQSVLKDPKLRRLIDEAEGSYGCKAIPVQSMGVYRAKTDGYGMVFENKVDNIIVYLLMDLIRFGEGVQEIVLDISTGLNYYLMASLDALRAYVVYRKLMEILAPTKGFKASLLCIPPPATKTVNVELYEFDVKAFFAKPFKHADSPISKAIEDKSLRRKLSEEGEYRKLSSISKRLVSVLSKSYNAVSKNLPLTLFYRDIVGMDKRTNEEIDACFSGLNQFLGVLESKYKEIGLKNGNLYVSRVKLYKTPIINLILSLAMLKSFYGLYREYIFPYNEGSVPLTYIKDNFMKLYSDLGLGVNKRYLERDVNEIERYGEELKEGERATLLELKERHRESPKEHEENGKGYVVSDQKRNFFAHSGFLREFTLVCKNKGELRVEYIKKYRDQDVMHTIKRWLESP